jgi:hypothetical protein
MAMLTEEQYAWTVAMEHLVSLRPKRHLQPPEDPCRAWLFRFSRQRLFENAILGSILLNTTLLAADSYGISDRQHAIHEMLSNLCTLLFAAEAAVKIAAVGWKNYVGEPWNVFDVSVTFFAVLDVLASLVSDWGDKQPALLRIFRLARLLFAVRVVRAARGLNMLFGMLLVSLAGLLNILGVYMILLSIYTLLSMQLFGHVAHGDYINVHANFCTFPAAMLTLFRCATGEDWNGLMRDAQITQEDGGCTEAAGDCGSWAAVPFFLSYVLLAKFFILKMTIALISDFCARANACPGR